MSENGGSRGVQPDLAGKVVLVTGATDGIGRLTAGALVDRGAHVLVHGRARDKLDALVDELRARGGGRVTGCLADFASLAAVRELAAQIGREHAQLHVLLNNAGLGLQPRRTSEDGHQLVFQVNHLAPFLLTRLLSDLLQRSAPARVVNTASIGQRAIDFDDPMLERGYDPMLAYCQSKLAMIMTTMTMAEQIDARTLTVNALHPGTLLDTKMVREGFGRAQGKAEEGMQAQLFLALDPQLDGVSGRYFDRVSDARAEAQAYDPQARQRLWELSERLVGL